MTELKADKTGIDRTDNTTRGSGHEHDVARGGREDLSLLEQLVRQQMVVCGGVRVSGFGQGVCLHGGASILKWYVNSGRAILQQDLYHVYY
jgi:hypothetical protein